VIHWDPFLNERCIVWPGSYSFLGDGMVFNITFTFTALTDVTDLQVGAQEKDAENLWWVCVCVSENEVYRYKTSQLCPSNHRGHGIFSPVGHPVFTVSRPRLKSRRQVYLGTSDDWIGTSDQPRKEQGLDLSDPPGNKPWATASYVHRATVRRTEVVIKPQFHRG